jgi:RES domain-containing protein
VTLWRVCQRRYAAEPLSGRGGLEVGGRWHLRGSRVVYTSATLSLAVLEILAQVDLDLVPGDMVQLRIEAPDDLRVERMELAGLPEDWRSYPAPPSLAEVGTEWLKRQESAILSVPSALIPEERNYLINPEQVEAPRIRVASVRELRLDPRLAR